MTAQRVAINGFGRIGRLSLRQLIKKQGVDIVAVNDLTDVNTLAHLFKWDSIHGKYPGTVEVQDGQLVIDGDVIEVFAERNPSDLPWAKLNIDVVIESTGVFRDRAGAGKHIEAGAKNVVISAPAKGDITTVVLGVNEEVLSKGDNIISNASCTTNCLAPMVKVLDDVFGVEKGFITTIHAYTSDQSIQDAPHSDLRRARAAAMSMIPTTTGAASAVGLVLPKMKGKLDGSAVRVPTPDGSLTDLTAILSKEVTAEQVNAAMKSASEGALKGILEYTDEPLVSVDIVGNTHSCIFDSSLTSANGTLVKLLGWYDNEVGYSSRVADLVVKLGK
ncbi:MAG: type I glyceraldehyde-3-phosphate dehydrogenase [Flavobacteriales bacterium]|nr:type I glyceraldehyde-3-phosphate dehydrogenase [Flavobacteriales bacterium]MDG1781915.1 type I glyceraldehyde-3-phosphate dehydrogenase [Flavobacteriales bacterium]MDG2247165.1 type I glyceraldehyde-3-phosphate dehydrogenase [Flavobacteriales bacterium]